MKKKNFIVKNFSFEILKVSRVSSIKHGNQGLPTFKEIGIPT